jgi:hypothetical protein
MNFTFNPSDGNDGPKRAPWSSKLLINLFESLYYEKKERFLSQKNKHLCYHTTSTSDRVIRIIDRRIEEKINVLMNIIIGKPCKVKSNWIT